MRRRPFAGWLLAGVLLATSVRGAGEIRPGAYCPFPKPGETPACMLPAKQAYGEFFAALDAERRRRRRRARARRSGRRGGRQLRERLPRALVARLWLLPALAAGRRDAEQRSGDRGAPRALECAARAAPTPTSPQDASFQDSVREAALDLQRRSPKVALSCLDESGAACPATRPTPCVRDIDRLRDEVGVRGALARLLGRFFGDARRRRAMSRSLPRRMLRAARLESALYEEVEAEPRSLGAGVRRGAARERRRRAGRLARRAIRRCAWRSRRSSRSCSGSARRCSRTWPGPRSSAARRRRRTSPRCSGRRASPSRRDCCACWEACPRSTWRACISRRRCSPTSGSCSLRSSPCARRSISGRSARSATFGVAYLLLWLLLAGALISLPF